MVVEIKAKTAKGIAAEVVRVINKEYGATFGEARLTDKEYRPYLNSSGGLWGIAWEGPFDWAIYAGMDGILSGEGYGPAGINLQLESEDFYLEASTGWHVSVVPM